MGSAGNQLRRGGIQEKCSKRGNAGAPEYLVYSKRVIARKYLL